MSFPEDILLIYSQPYFEGNVTVVIQNEFNITHYRPASLRITGEYLQFTELTFG